MTTFTSRRSIRRYSKKPVDEALLYRLLGDAERTQTMGNLQLYSVVITRSNEMKTQLAPAHFLQPMVMGAPVVLTFCADFRRTTLWAKQRKAHPGYDNILSFFNAATDALLYCQTFCNMAEEEGLGLCFLGTTVYNPESIIDTLKLPPLVFPVATITLGWPNECPEQTDRLPLSAIIHQETYADYSPERIDEAYYEKENTAENRHFVEINNVETLAQIFTDIRYTRKDNEAMSETLIKALQRQGFLNNDDKIFSYAAITNILS